MDEALPKLTQREVVLIRGHFEGRDQAALARELGLSRQRVGQLLGALRARGLPIEPRADRHRSAAVKRWSNSRG